VARLNELEPASRFDVRRFRMNVVIDADEAGFVENRWIGRRLAIGGAVRADVAMPDPR
jgi:MOSC domain-containing protein